MTVPATTSTVSPNDVLNKQFTVVQFKKGYDQDEVDGFLDQVADSYEQVLRQLDNTQQQLRAAAGAVTQKMAPVVDEVKAVATADAQPTLSSIALLLESAQKTAEQMIGDARTQAAGIAANAKADADKALADARTAGAALLAEAEQKRNEVIGAIESQRATIAAKVVDLTNTHAGVVQKLEGALAKLKGEL